MVALLLVGFRELVGLRIDVGLVDWSMVVRSGAQKLGVTAG